MSNAAEKNKDKKKRNTIIMIICVLIIIVLIGVILYLLRSEETGRNRVVTKDNVEEVVDDMLNQEYVEPGHYSVSMSTTWHFANGKAASEDAYVENQEGNTNDVYFDVVRADNEEEVLLESPIIPRGSELDNITLDKELPAGTYDCVMIYHLIDDKENTVSTLRVAFTIVVEK